MMVIRQALRQDAAAMGDLYVRVWQETYPGLIPNETLLAMCPDRAAERWETMIDGAGRRRGALVATLPGAGVIGLASYGPNRDKALDFQGEIFTLYVDPDFAGLGAGSGLLSAIFGALAEEGMDSALVWTLSLNPHRFFYEAQGGILAARKRDRIADVPVELSAFAWKALPGDLKRDCPIKTADEEPS